MNGKVKDFSERASLSIRFLAQTLFYGCLVFLAIWVALSLAADVGAFVFGEDMRPYLNDQALLLSLPIALLSAAITWRTLRFAKASRR